MGQAAGQGEGTWLQRKGLGGEEEAGEINLLPSQHFRWLAYPKGSARTIKVGLQCKEDVDSLDPHNLVAYTGSPGEPQLG